MLVLFLLKTIARAQSKRDPTQYVSPASMLVRKLRVIDLRHPPSYFCPQSDAEDFHLVCVQPSPASHLTSATMRTLSIYPRTKNPQNAHPQPDCHHHGSRLLRNNSDTQIPSHVPPLLRPQLPDRSPSASTTSTNPHCKSFGKNTPFRSFAYTYDQMNCDDQPEDESHW